MSLAPETVAALEAGVAYERERTGPPRGFPTLPPMRAGRYVDPDFLALEDRYLWKRAWLYAGHRDQLPTPGSTLVVKRAGSAVLLVHGEDGAIRAFYNTCQHRGAPLVRDETSCVAGNLVCGYHGWTYDLEGKLVGVLDARDFPGLDRSRRGLRPVRCEALGNWLFVSQDPEAPPLAEGFGPLDAYFRSFPLETLRLVDRAVFSVRCNVKVLLENFLEAYHFKFLHKHTTDRFLDSRGTHILLWEGGHSIMLTPNRREGWVDPGTVGMPEMAHCSAIERDHNPSINVFPNLITPVAPTGIPMVAMWPRGPRESELEVLWMAPDWGGGPRDPLWETRIANFGRIVEEDVQFAEEIQESVESQGFHSVPLGYQERRIYHWHEELDRRIGAERVPPALRVEPVLGAWRSTGWASPAASGRGSPAASSR